MSTTTQPKSSAARMVPSILQAKPGRLEETSEISRAVELIRSGEAVLKVVAYPWGVEFEICGAEGEK